VEKPETVATAIRIGNPASWKGAVAARDESGGLIDSVTDEEISWAYRFIAESEGVFAEPASAAAVAGVAKLARKKYFKDIEGTQIVCTLTGAGLKDPDYALSFDDKPLLLEPRVDAVLKAISL
jgi:threonine synthase